MNSNRKNISFLILLFFFIISVIPGSIYAQDPVIDTFSTSISFNDGIIDSRWTTVKANQLLEYNTETFPEESDLSGYWKAGYNPESHLFYVLVDVKDDSITSEQFVYPDSLYYADHITIYFDLFNDGFSYYNRGYSTFALFPLTEQYQGRVGQTSFGLGDYSYIEKIDKNITSDGWFMEILFNFETLMGSSDLQFIDTIGFEAVISDNDKGWGRRDFRLSWNDPNVSVWENPTLMRDIILDKKLNATFKPTCSADFEYADYLNNGEGRVGFHFSDQSTSNDEIINWSWEFGDNDNQSTQNPNHIYDPFSENINACLFLTTRNGCNSSYCNSIIIPNKQFSLEGNVHGELNFANNWKVLAFINAGSQYQLFDSYELSGTGFSFPALDRGNYLLYALPEETDNNSFPGYFVNKEHWQESDLINVNGNVFDVDIQLNSIPYDISGSGSVSGSLNQSTQGIPIILSGENGHQLKYTLSGKSGEFYFNELPFGKYIVYPEYPGFNNAGQSITLTAEYPDRTGVQFNQQGILSTTALPETPSRFEIKYNQSAKELQITNLYDTNRPVRITIYNMLGDLLYSNYSNLSGSTTIDAGNFNARILLIHILDGKTIQAEKIIW
ncbi:MAG: hypothetical protein JXA77_03230 [Bacteroidales bacterium]|nr:hypothetical protein [Bacteroidales bacterium]MBN2817539.1 hypothetical protein [Bacteroidales bacterium]